MSASFTTPLCGVSSMSWPAYLFNSGFTSKLSRWLNPPIRKIQMTDLARGVNCGRPFGGVNAGADEKRDDAEAEAENLIHEVRQQRRGG